MAETTTFRSVAALNRTELLVDLELTPSLCCPTCVIHCIDPDWDDTCRSDCCQYEFEESTSPAEVLQEWTEDVLREAYRTRGIRLYLKWAERLGRMNDEQLLMDRLHSRRIFVNYDLEEFGRILDALQAAGVTLEPGRWQNRMNDEEFALLILKQSTQTE